MRLLLDTHTFIWWDSEPEKLSEHGLDLMEDEEHDLILSLASIWEMQIKHQLGKLTLRTNLAELINDHQAHGLILLPITLTHVISLGSLPTHHKDPFDRMLAAQALSEDLTLLTRDPYLQQYPIKTVW